MDANGSLTSEPAIDALRLSDDECLVLHRSLNSGRTALSGPSAPDVRGRRWTACVHDARLVLQIQRPKDDPVYYLVRPYRTSPGFLCLLHGGFIHTGTKVGFHFRAEDGEELLLSGTVSQCLHVRDRVHDVEIAFDFDIDVSEFIAGGSARPCTQRGALERATPNRNKRYAEIARLSKQLERLAADRADESVMRDVFMSLAMFF